MSKYWTCLGKQAIVNAAHFQPIPVISSLFLAIFSHTKASELISSQIQLFPEIFFQSFPAFSNLSYVECQVSPVTCHMSLTCQLLLLTYHLSTITCQMLSVVRLVSHFSCVLYPFIVLQCQQKCPHMLQNYV